MPKLTHDLIQSTAAPERGSITLWDGDHREAIRGFGLRIFAPTKRHPEGARSFFVNYRDAGGFERRHTIGLSPVWTVTAARAEAKELRRRIDAGGDPVAEKMERRNAPTVRDLIDRYIADHLPTKAQGHRAKDERRMLAEIGRLLGAERRVVEIHHGDVQHMHRAITESGRPVRANRVLSIASKMFSLALLPRVGEAKPWRDAAMGNPCRGIKRNPEEGKERFLSEAELALLADQFADAKDTSMTTDAIRLTMLTGCRPDEAMKARWEQFDSEPGFWVKPAANVKQRRVHKLPLSPAALELIERIRKRRGECQADDWIFPGRKSGHPVVNLKYHWQQMRERASVRLWAASEKASVAKVVADLRKRLKREPSARECRIEAERWKVSLPVGLLDARLYDLRHTFASIGAAGGLSLLVIGKLLGHTRSQTTLRYAHLHADPLRDAATKITTTITGAERASAKVVPLRGEQ
jgi:integrase